MREAISLWPLHGVAGASGNQADYEENERIITAALLRMAQMGDVPYFIATDANIDPAKSEAIQKAREAMIACDVVSDAYGGSPPPTFCRPGVFDGIKGSGITRNDAFIVNPAAAHANGGITYDYLSGRIFDHVPINMAIVPRIRCRWRCNQQS